jgi:hypothetical protein
VNRGILHRDISDGNVMMLCDSQEFARREWKEPSPAKCREQEPMIAKSEELLRGLLDKLGRNPTGMLTDFDLFATHSLIEASFFSDTPQEQEESSTQAGSSFSIASEAARDEDQVPQSKRRKKNTRASTASSPHHDRGSGPRMSQQADVGECRNKQVDFRTVSFKVPFCTVGPRR